MLIQNPIHSSIDLGVAGAGWKGEVRAEVILGSPANKCAGLGICMVFPEERPMRCTCPGAPAVICLEADGRLCFTFSRSSLTESLWEKHFSGPYFLVEGAFKVPRWLQKRLGDWGSVVILPGVYPFYEEEGRVVVVF